ncbi:hypothetical protein [Litorihabitans aurantiacus]|uniref:Uncharacterized protein n=1 Tax=Litorihabitans aurantiacus TaxID=1930061 RepID=A0AA37XHZ7_9MICO|nr:hypothetical protein [Litorihabitans aurantiacus]GMA33675.1 hypothetical protein GCM10025875_36670 [Litorihabitans aurantiacus]GMA33744.1 hypothetical protein GCM10025875_37360 [Litorihabitans aurantiacus]
MRATVTVTTAPRALAPGPVDYGHVSATAESYEAARDDALARVPEGRRAVAIRVERT